jgi:selenocysteine lyase/cysteine desulfurase
MFDGAHTPGMMTLDVKEIDCDFFATCGHKWMMGPKGTGFLYVRKELLELLEPCWAGALSDAGWDLTKGTLTYRQDAHKYDFGTQSSALSVGLGAAVDFLHHIGMDNITRHNKALATRLRTGLQSLGDRVEILTPEEEGGYCSVIGFRLRAMAYDKLQPYLLEKHKIITRMVPENGINCNRISAHIYNTTDDVDRVVEAIKAVA